MLENKRPISARKYSGVSLFLVVVFTGFSILILLLLKDYIPLLGINDVTVAKISTKMIPMLSAALFFSSINIVYSGSIRAIGCQTIGTLIEFISYGLIMFPIGITLSSLYKLGLEGIWIGIISGCFIEGGSLSILLFCSNWRYFSIAAVHNTKREKILLNIQELEEELQD